MPTHDPVDAAELGMLAQAGDRFVELFAKDLATGIYSIDDEHQAILIQTVWGNARGRGPKL